MITGSSLSRAGNIKGDTYVSRLVSAYTVRDHSRCLQLHKSCRRVEIDLGNRNVHTRKEKHPCPLTVPPTGGQRPHLVLVPAAAVSMARAGDKWA